MKSHEVSRVPKQQNTQKHNQTIYKHQKQEESDRRSSSVTSDEKEMIALYQLGIGMAKPRKERTKRHNNHIAIPLRE
jgi:hypothetical protein